MAQVPSAPEVSAPVAAERKRPHSLRAKDVLRIAEKSTSDQITQLAEARARNQGRGTTEAKDRKWADRLMERYKRAHHAHEQAKQDVGDARKGAAFGDDAALERYRILRSQRDTLGEKLSILQLPFQEAQIQLDPSQRPPTIQERIGKGRAAVVGKAQEFGSAIKTGVETRLSAAGARVDSARSALAAWVGERVLAAKTMAGALSERTVKPAREFAERARIRAKEVLGPFVEMVERDRIAIRERAVKAVEDLEQLVQKGGTLAQELATGALGLPGKGLEGARMVGGMVVDKYGKPAMEAVARQFREQKAAWDSQVIKAKTRLNRIFEVYGDAAAPMLKFARDRAEDVAGIGRQTVEFVRPAVEKVRAIKERAVRVAEGLATYIVDTATEAWAKTGLSKTEIGRRAALLKGALVAAGRTVGEATLRGAVMGTALAAEGASALRSKKGLALAGGASLAVLAATHPDILQRLQEILPQIPQAGAEGFIQQPAIPGGFEQFTSPSPDVVPGPVGTEAVTAPPIQTEPVLNPVTPQAEISSQPPNLQTVPPEAPTSSSLESQAVASVTTPMEAANFYSNLSSHVIERGGNVYQSIQEMAKTSLGPNNLPVENNILLSDMIADSVVKILEHDGVNASLAHQGNTVGEFFNRATDNGRTLIERVSTVGSVDDFRTLWPDVQQYIRG